VEFLLVLLDLAYFLGGTDVSPSSFSVAFEFSPSKVVFVAFTFIYSKYSTGSE